MSNTLFPCTSNLSIAFKKISGIVKILGNLCKSVFDLWAMKKQDSHISLPLALGVSIQLLRVGGNGFQAQEKEEGKREPCFIVGGIMNFNRLLPKQRMYFFTGIFLLWLLYFFIIYIRYLTDQIHCCELAVPDCYNMLYTFI